MGIDRVAVMGAGAVGCYYGAMLARSGVAVTLIGRASLAEAVAERGLILETESGTERVEVAATTGAGGAADAGLVLLTVKAGDLVTACADLAPHLAPGAIVLGMQNGIGHVERAAALLGRPVLPASVYAAVSMSGAGRVRHLGGGALALGDGPGAAAAAGCLRRAGVPVEITPDIERVLWTKLTVNCVYNALSAVTGLPYGRIVAEAGADRMMAAVTEECRAVAAAEGVDLPPDIWTTVRRVADTMPGQRSSTAQDLARGRRTEIGFLNGEVVRRGDAAGVPVPLNQALLVMVRLAEADAVAAPSGG